VAALDVVETAVSSGSAQAASASFVCGDARRLPFADNSFDLVFSQCVLLWTGSTQAAAEIHRVLEPNGVLIGLEPDYAGMIEYPPEIGTRDIWLAALARAGAEPRIGRVLPGVLAELGFEVRVDLLDSLVTPSRTRFDFLRTLPLTPDEAEALERAAAAASHLGGAWRQVVHLPVLLISATKI
jgi:SAM-dependent methyltransferase